ncbi:hypothetical protein [Spirillospora sp. NPDC047279]|uniref:hypothetical protein n=1 Tax=Spirillospora sp. NPDC047279 TaxID=3155478 RepID=UPI0034012D25
MTDWTQHHPTTQLTAPDGRTVAIDVEMVPLVTELWRLGFATKVACQDAGEATREGGTRTPQAERQRVAARLMGRAWLVIRAEEAKHLLDVWAELAEPEVFLLRPTKNDSEPADWVSLTFPRELIAATTQELRSIASLRLD